MEEKNAMSCLSWKLVAVLPGLLLTPGLSIDGSRAVGEAAAAEAGGVTSQSDTGATHPLPPEKHRQIDGSIATEEPGEVESRGMPQLQRPMQSGGPSQSPSQLPTLPQKNEAADRSNEWISMPGYKVWEGQRKDFIYPENWVAAENELIADLIVTMKGVADPVHQVQIYQITVRNQGNARAQGVAFTHAFSMALPGTSIAKLEGNGPVTKCSSREAMPGLPIISCTVQQLDAGATAGATIVYRNPGNVPRTSTVQANSSVQDLKPADNAMTITVPAPSRSAR